jgi:hypothetical protein
MNKFKNPVLALQIEETKPVIFHLPKQFVSLILTLAVKQ